MVVFCYQLTEKPELTCDVVFPRPPPCEWELSPSLLYPRPVFTCQSELWRYLNIVSSNIKMKHKQSSVHSSERVKETVCQQFSKLRRRPAVSWWSTRRLSCGLIPRLLVYDQFKPVPGSGLDLASTQAKLQLEALWFQVVGPSHRCEHDISRTQTNTDLPVRHHQPWNLLQFLQSLVPRWRSPWWCWGVGSGGIRIYQGIKKILTVQF